MLSVGLTGGIASGKSLAAHFFQKCGAHIVDADTIARNIVESGSAGWERVVEHFGRSVLTHDGNLDRSKLAHIIFSNEQQRAVLNNILHPLILDKIKEQLFEIAVRDPAAIVVVDVPLLIECGLQKDFDRIVVVYSDRDTRKRRLIQRNNLSEKDAEYRLRAQMDLNAKKKYADYVIDNSTSRQYLKKQVGTVYSNLIKELAGQEKC